MNGGPPTRRQDFDFIEDLAAGIEGTSDHENNKNHTFQSLAKCPHLKVNIMRKETIVLLDSGSQITAISEDFYKELSTQERLSSLPVSNLYVTTAIGKKSTTIKKQIWLEIELGGRILSCPFLVIPFLTSTVILGNDWMLRHEVILNYKSQTIEVAGTLLSDSTVVFGRGASETLLCSRKDTGTFVYVVNLPDMHREENGNSNNCMEIVKGITDSIGSKGDILPVRGKCREGLIDSNNVSVKNKISVINDNVDVRRNEIVLKKTEEPSTSKVVCRSSTEENKEIECVYDEFSGALQTIAGALTSLEESQRGMVVDTLRKFRLLFSNKPGCAEGYEHQLKLVTNRPSIRYTYPVPFQLREPTRQAIKEMVENGVVERAISQYCNPLRIVKKEDGSVRVCLDGRFLNKMIEDDHESPPLINELLQKFHGARWFSKLDLTQGYWQIKLQKDSRPYTSFLFDSKLYQFCRIPFGLKTAGSGFMRALSHALNNEFDWCTSCYIDDILIGTSTFEEHINVLRRIFQRLMEFNFTIKVSKCCFFQESVPFLGFVIARKGIKPEERKLDAILNFDQPRNKKELQQFLGVCNYYRQFNVNHSYSIDHLRNLLTKGKDWIWTEKHSEAFKRLKNDFAECITLKHVIPERQFRLQTDASDSHTLLQILQILQFRK